MSNETRDVPWGAIHTWSQGEIAAEVRRRDGVADRWQEEIYDGTIPGWGIDKSQANLIVYRKETDRLRSVLSDR